MTKKEAIGALGSKGDHDFFAKFHPLLKTRKVKNKVQYFVPVKMMIKTYKDLYADTAVEYDEQTEAVEDVLGDISDTTGVIADDLTAARLDNLRARTKLIEEKLDARKQELFTEWSEKFFEVFASSFAKLKNFLIELHLDDAQLRVFTEKLDDALKSMEDKLTQLNSEWMEEEEQEQL